MTCRERCLRRIVVALLLRLRLPTDRLSAAVRTGGAACLADRVRSLTAAFRRDPPSPRLFLRPHVFGNICFDWSHIHDCLVGLRLFGVTVFGVGIAVPFRISILIRLSRPTAAKAISVSVAPPFSVETS